MRMRSWMRYGAAVTALMLAVGALALQPVGRRSAPVPLGAVASDPVVGSQDTAVADPPMRHPDETPIIVTLFSDQAFADFNIKTFPYVPPADCPGPWAKVILVGDFNVTEGVQYDRTGQITIGHVNVYYGTTPEPSSSLGPTWHFERDLTDYTALLMSPQDGEAILGNIVNATYTGIIYGTAKIEFYPATSAHKAPKVPDAVLPLHDASGGAVVLNTIFDSLSRTFTLPPNVENAYLDVFAQSQNYDEFWYTCVPDDVADELQSCGATAFREVEITLDNEPAGVTPITPWMYTGAIDPFLWEPIPGVQTLNFVPYRVDLTPLASRLNDGQPHTLSLVVYNADIYFLADATLLLNYDAGSQVVSGEVTENTLATNADPNPAIAENLNATDSSITGSVSVTSVRQFTIAGFLRTSHGKVVTRLKQKMSFSNVQQFQIDDTTYLQDIVQGTDVTAKVTTTKGSDVREETARVSYPLHVNLTEKLLDTGNISLVTTIDQQVKVKESVSANGSEVSLSTVSNEVAPTDTMMFNGSGHYIGHQDQKSAQTYKSSDSQGRCYSRTVEAADNAVTKVTDGKGCK